MKFYKRGEERNFPGAHTGNFWKELPLNLMLQTGGNSTLTAGRKGDSREAGDVCTQE